MAKGCPSHGRWLHVWLALLLLYLTIRCYSGRVGDIFNGRQLSAYGHNLSNSFRNRCGPLRSYADRDLDGERDPVGPFGLEVAANSAARLPRLKAFMYEGPHGDCHTAFVDLRVPSLQVLVLDAKQAILRTDMRCMKTSYEYNDISWGLIVPAQTLAPQALRMVTEFSDYSDASQHDLLLMVAKQSQQQPPHLAEGATSAEDGAVRRALHAACGKTAANQVLGAGPCRSAEMGVTGRTRIF